VLNVVRQRLGPSLTTFGASWDPSVVTARFAPAPHDVWGVMGPQRRKRPIPAAAYDVRHPPAHVSPRFNAAVDVNGEFAALVSPELLESLIPDVGRELRRVGAHAVGAAEAQDLRLGPPHPSATSSVTGRGRYRALSSMSTSANSLGGGPNGAFASAPRRWGPR
jgi:hypothetical protein